MSGLWSDIPTLSIYSIMSGLWSDIPTLSIYSIMSGLWSDIPFNTLSVASFPGPPHVER